ncbi:MAG TPA: iron-containing redox enzyme family protein [Caulifigura sp.]|jgi:hypothetical protein|nr:iron-containing redox enzyme family protein [Caulifigura sp.]
MSPDEFVSRLRRKTADHLAIVQDSELFRRFIDPGSDSVFVVEIVKNALLETWSYGPHVTEATFAAIGRFDKRRPDLMRRATAHVLDEVNHGEIALADYCKWGGDQSWARQRRMTPASFAMAATVRMIAAHESPYAFLGYMYLLEALTPSLTATVQDVLAQRGLIAKEHIFMAMHAKEDITHERELAALIDDVVTAFPNEAESIEYAFDVFAAVYPLPIWDAILSLHGDGM